MIVRTVFEKRNNWESDASDGECGMKLSIVAISSLRNGKRSYTNKISQMKVECIATHVVLSSSNISIINMSEYTV